MSLFSWSDLREAARGLTRTPAVTIAAVLCLGLGLGATTAIFSAVNVALLEPLPLRDPGRLVSVFRTAPQANTWPFSAPNYLDLARGTRQLEGIAAVGWASGLLTLPDRAVSVTGYRVTGNFFPLLGARAQAGRLLTASDDERDATPVLVLSDALWRREFGADPAVIGRTLTLDGTGRTVVGILPPRFQVPHGGFMLTEGDYWAPMRFTQGELAGRFSNWLMTMGRLAPGATIASAGAELHGLFDGLIQTFPSLNGEQVRVVPMAEDETASVRTPLLLMLGAVGFVLLIAATNVASLLLARGVQRRRDTAIRTALGGGRWAVMRPVLAESALLTGGGVVLGLLLAWLGTRTIGRMAAASLPQVAGLGINLTLIGFAVGLSVVVALVCGGVPAWRSSRVPPADALRGGRSAGTGQAQHRALHTLVVAAVALSLVLLIGAGLVLKGFASLIGRDPGFDPAAVLTMQVTISPDAYQGRASRLRFLDPALAAVQAVPGVAAAGSISMLPYRSWGTNFNVRYVGQPEDNLTQRPLLESRLASPGFFQVTRQRLLAGRLLTAEDAAKPGALAVAVVNEATVRRDFPGQTPAQAIGARFYQGDSTETIVGVVSDIRDAGPVRAPVPEAYFPYNQDGGNDATFNVVVRAAGGDPNDLARGVTAAIRGVDKGAAVSAVMPMSEVIASSVGRPRFYLSLLAAFAVVALALAVAGLYGVMSYAVAQRTREIGIRGALGASAARTVALVARQGLGLVGLGAVLGMAGAAALTRLLTSLLYGVSPADLTTWLLATTSLVAAGALATLIPARRAAAVDPLIAIREE